MPNTTPVSLPEVPVNDLDHVTGGQLDSIRVPTEDCPTCVSGTDPTVQSDVFQPVISGDLP